jgi:Domain of unknown function (DUF4177)
MKEYKVVIYREPLLGSIFLGGSRVNPERYTDFLNRNAQQGWRVVTMERELRRELLFFKREAFLTILERDNGHTSASSY